MPIREFVCESTVCKLRGRIQEHYMSHRDAPPQPCDNCAGPTRQLISRPNIIWTGSIGRYNDPSLAYAEETKDGHWACRKNASRRPDGKPEWEFITNVAQQRQYCREEGLVMPSDMGNNLIASEDGMSMSNAGMPGQEI